MLLIRDVENLNIIKPCVAPKKESNVNDVMWLANYSTGLYVWEGDSRGSVWEGYVPVYVLNLVKTGITCKENSCSSFSISL